MGERGGDVLRDIGRDTNATTPAQWYTVPSGNTIVCEGCGAVVQESYREAHNALHAKLDTLVQGWGALAEIGRTAARLTTEVTDLLHDLFGSARPGWVTNEDGALRESAGT